MRALLASARKRGVHHVSLVAYFAFAFWAVSMVIVWSVTALFAWWDMGRIEQQLRAMAQSVASTIGVTQAESWDRRSGASLAPSIHEAAGQSNIAYIRARLPGGGVLASAGDPGVSNTLVYVETAPVLYFGQPVGTVEVAIYRSAARDLFGHWMQLGLTVSVGATLVSAVAALAGAYVATRPIRQLQEAAVRWEQPLELDLEKLQGPNEVMELARAVLAMRERALARTSDLEEEVAERTEQLAQMCTTVETSFQQTAAALAQALDARDRLTALHSNRTSELAYRIGVRMGLSQDDLRTLSLAATLHDIGKIGVPEHILTKPGPLTPEEWTVMRSHPIISASILQPVAGMAEVTRLVRYHHERWDGRGYPDGLKGTEIPLGSRIIALADTVEAMSARRHYRHPLPAAVILQEVVRSTGTQFDPDVVQAGLPEVESAAHEWFESAASQLGPEQT